MPWHANGKERQFTFRRLARPRRRGSSTRKQRIHWRAGPQQAAGARGHASAAEKKDLGGRHWEISLTATHLGETPVTTLRTLLLLDVVGDMATAAARRVRLVVTRAGTAHTLRPVDERERKEV